MNPQEIGTSKGNRKIGQSLYLINSFPPKCWSNAPSLDWPQFEKNFPTFPYSLKAGLIELGE